MCVVLIIYAVLLQVDLIIFASLKLISSINTTSSNLVTVVTSSTPDHQLDSSPLPLHFTSIDNQLPSSLFPYPGINAITVPPKIWREKAPTKYKPIIYDDVDEDLYLFKLFRKVC